MEFCPPTRDARLVQMRTISSRTWIYVVVSAALQILIFPLAGPLSAWPAALSWIALAPWMAALLLRGKAGLPIGFLDAAVLSYLCGILWYLGNCYWIYQTMYLYGGLPRPAAIIILVLFALYLGLYHCLFGVLFALAQRTRLGSFGALLAAPFLWVSVELARARITGFPWDLLGYSQVNNLFLTRLAPLAGVMALSFVLSAVNATLVPLLLPVWRKYIPLALAAFVLAVAGQLAGQLPTFKLGARRQATQTATMMQENLLVGEAARGSKPLSDAEEMALFSRWSENPLHHRDDGAWRFNSESQQPDVIVWPEAPSNLQSDDPLFRQEVGQLARSAGSVVIAGSLGVDAAPSVPRGYYLYDSASLFAADGTYQSRYDKIHLVPWGEYVPFKALFSFAKKLTAGVGDMDRGRKRTVFRSGGHSYGVFICYESIFGDEVRQFVANGADVLVNISDDGWYGDTGAPWQHLNMARMRAIENHRWLLRSTNTGVTTAIDPRGRIAFSAPRHVRAAFSFPFDFVSNETFYTRHGDWFAWLCVLIALGFVGAALSPATRSKQID